MLTWAWTSGRLFAIYVYLTSSIFDKLSTLDPCNPIDPDLVWCYRAGQLLEIGQRSLSLLGGTCGRGIASTASSVPSSVIFLIHWVLVLFLSACHGMRKGAVVRFTHLTFCCQEPFKEWCEASAELKQPWNCSNLHLEQEQAKLVFSRSESCNNIIPNCFRSSDEHLKILPQAAEDSDWITVDYVL